MNAKYTATGISKFLFSTLVATSAMTAPAWAITEITINPGDTVQVTNQYAQRDENNALIRDENGKIIYDYKVEPAPKFETLYGLNSYTDENGVKHEGGNVYTEDTRFTFTGDYTTEKGVNMTLNGGNVSFAADNAVTIKQATNWIFSGQAGTLTIGENVTIDTIGGTKNLSFNVSEGVNLNVEGKISRTANGMGALNLTGGNHTVSATGTIATESLYIKSAAELTITGDANSSRSEAHLGIGQGLYLEEGGRLTAQNSIIKAGTSIELASGSSINVTGSALSAYALQNATGMKIFANEDLGLDSDYVVLGSSIILKDSVLEVTYLNNSFGGNNLGEIESSGMGEILKSSLRVENSTITADTIVNTYGTIEVYGNSTINAGSISGDKIVVTEGATLTVSSNSLLAMIDNSANEGSGNIAFNKVESAMTTKEITLKSGDGNAVQLAANAEITISRATEITDTAAIETLAGGVVLSAWDFVIDNAEAGVTVTMDVGDGLDLESLRIYHEENGNWTDVTDVVTDKQLENGKLSFMTNSFSGYAAVAMPEPSAFGLLAGLAALALVGARRRRR